MQSSNCFLYNLMQEFLLSEMLSLPKSQVSYSKSLITTLMEWEKTQEFNKT